MSKKKEYILGADEKELFRLGIQHQIWATEAQLGWSLAQFNAGDTLLDLGCGPGFCTKELAFLVGERGRVIGIDIAENYIEHLLKTKDLHNLNIEAIATDFNDMTLPENSLDGMYCRWALAWIPNPKEILHKVQKALKTGGKMVLHEYYDWSTHQTEPKLPELDKAITASLKSFNDSPGNIDIGRKLPDILNELGMKITNQRLMPKLAMPHNINWQWPKTFYHSYFSKLVDMGYLNNIEAKKALEAMDKLEQNKNSTIFCPIMVEIIAEKI